MEIAEQLLKMNSRKTWDEVIAFIGQDEERFAVLMDLYFNGETRIVQRASQPVGVIGEKQPRLIKPYLTELVTHLQSNPIDAVKRNTMRIFQFIDVPEDLEGLLFEIALNYLKSASEPVAIKAFSMTALRKIATKHPDLAIEVIHQIEILVEEKVSKGIVSRGNSELKKLHSICSEN